VNSSNQIESIIQDTFEDVALLIGASSAINRFDDAETWSMMRRLYRLRSQALARLSAVIDPGSEEPAIAMPVGAHAAVEHFLRLNRGVPMRIGSEERKESAETEESRDAKPRKSGGTKS
jgi:hypothetical protein